MKQIWIRKQFSTQNCRGNRKKSEFRRHRFRIVEVRTWFQREGIKAGREKPVDRLLSQKAGLPTGFYLPRWDKSRSRPAFTCFYLGDGIKAGRPAFSKRWDKGRSTGFLWDKSRSPTGFYLISENKSRSTGFFGPAFIPKAGLATGFSETFEMG